MSSEYIIALVALMAILLALSAFFSASETAYTGLSTARLKAMDAEGDNRKIQRTLANSEDFDRLLTTILVGNNIVNIASSTICTALMTDIFGDLWGVVFATVIMITVLLIVGEITPKTWAKKNPEKIAISFSTPVYWVMRILSPITAVFLKLTKGVNRMTGAEESDSAITEEELGMMIDEIQQEGTLEKSESELVKSALEFDDTQVSEICVPRVDMVSVSITSDVETLRDLFIKTEFSRIPVYEGSIDRVIGAVFFKDFFMKYTTKRNVRIADLIRPVRFVPREASIDSVMNELQKSKVHMAIVLDDYGGTFGLVTMEDLLEELVGEIWDESDDVKHSYVKESDDTYMVLGDANLEEVCGDLGIKVDADECDSKTVSGYINYRLERLPQIGDKVDAGSVVMTVRSMRSRRIKEVTFLLRKQEEDAADEKGEEFTPEPGAQKQ